MGNCLNKQNDENLIQQIELLTSKENIRNVYTFVKVLGTGGFSLVKKAYLNINPNEFVAVKIIEKLKLQDKISMLLKEIQILKTLDHPNIIKFHEVYEDDKFFFIVQEFCSGGELLKKIMDQEFFAEQPAAHIIFKLMAAVLHMHKNNIVHRDLKPENILFIDKTPESELKIIDFGISKKYRDNTHIKAMVGTPLYVSPQILNGNYTEKCDIWSLGVLLYIILKGTPPFSGKTEQEIYEQILNKNQKIFEDEFWNEISQEAKDLISQLLKYDENERIELDDAMKHPWFQILKQEKQENKILYKTQRPNILNRLKNFHGPSLFKKEVMSLFINQLHEQDLHVLKTVFQQIDKDNSGMIEIKELQDAMKQCKIEIDDIQIKQIFDQLSDEEIKGQKVIKYSNFIAATLDTRRYLTEEKLWSLFNYFDESNNNFITAEGLQQIMQRQGQHKSLQEILGMMDEVAPNHQGKLSFETFKQIFFDEQITQKLDLKN